MLRLDHAAVSCYMLRSAVFCCLRSAKFWGQLHSVWSQLCAGVSYILDRIYSGSAIFWVSYIIGQLHFGSVIFYVSYIPSQLYSTLSQFHAGVSLCYSQLLYAGVSYSLGSSMLELAICCS